MKKTTNPPPLEEWATIADAARLCAINHHTLRRWIEDGVVETRNPHGTVMVLLASVRERQINPPTRGRPPKVTPQT